MTCRNCGGHDYKCEWDDEIVETDFCCRECLEEYIEWLQAQDKEPVRP
jgi:hypothetical protein